MTCQASNISILITVIIPTIGRPSLMECVSSLLSQTYPKDKTEILVIDDGTSTDYSWLPPVVKLYRLSNSLGPSAARNHGVRLAAGDIVAFTDDDCVVPSDWLVRIAKAFKHHPEAAAVGGYLRPTDLALATSAPARLEFIELHRMRILGARERLDGSDLSAAWGTNNLAWRKHCLFQVGGFDERLRVGEDSDLARRAGEMGMRTLFIPTVVLHNRPYTWSSFLAQHLDRGRQLSRSRGRREAGRALAGLALSVPKSLLLIKTMDLGVVAASIAGDLALKIGRVALIGASDNHRNTLSAEGESQPLHE